MVERHRYVIHGTLGNSGQEEWTTGVTVGASAPVEFPTSPTQLSEMADDFLTILRTGTEAGPLRALLGAAGAVTGVTLYHYPAAGPADSVGESTGAGFPGVGSIQMPPQAAVVFSLLTGIPGRSYRGRMYWPALNGVINIGLAQDVDDCQAQADAMAGVLAALVAANYPDPPYYVGVHSATQDVVTPVTRVAVGTRFDTQRRRREGLEEQYFVADLA